MINKYNILLILTDGVLTDWSDTCEAIFDSCYHPLSIIIIGIGYSNFEKLHLFNTNEFSAGHPMRKNIKFLNLADYIDRPSSEFIADCLGSIPFEMTEFCYINDYIPVQLPKEDLFPFPLISIPSLFYY